MDKLKVPLEPGKMCYKSHITWDEEDKTAFADIKKILCESLSLQRVNPTKVLCLEWMPQNVQWGMH